MKDLIALALFNINDTSSKLCALSEVEVFLTDTSTPLGILFSRVVNQIIT